MKNILLTIIVIIPFIVGAQQKDNRIKVDQVGYLTNSQKKAIVPTKAKGNFYLIDVKTNKKVFTGKLSKSKKWEYSNETVCIADFSSFNEQGNYYLKCSDKNVEKSFNFNISNNVYHEIANASLFAFYLARVSMPIEEQYAGKYNRPCGHPDTVVYVHESAASKERATGTVISSPGGWYDAGDYNKYIVNSGFSVYMLLHFSELYNQDIKNINLKIPESGSGIPDVIEELLYNLRWMVTMQDPNDGGVYHKLTNKSFGGQVQPHLINKPRYVIMKTTPATLNLASVCAKAYRVLKPYNNDLNGFADTCLAVAKKAYKWAKENPNTYYKQPEDINTGEYGDVRLADEFAWSSIELFLATGDDAFLQKNIEDILIYNIPSWPKTGTLGVYSLLNSSQTSDKINKKQIIKEFLYNANIIYKRYSVSAYNVSIKTFEWGSNSQSANEAIYLLMAYKYTNDIKYYNAASAILNYINGCNPLSMCYVTGFGTQSPINIHDRRSVSDEIEGPIPGYLVGGTNGNALADCGDEHYKHKEPAARYVDEYCSYSTNEIAINWNAVYAFLVNAIQIENENLKNK